MKVSEWKYQKKEMIGWRVRWIKRRLGENPTIPRVMKNLVDEHYRVSEGLQRAHTQDALMNEFYALTESEKYGFHENVKKRSHDFKEKIDEVLSLLDFVETETIARINRTSTDEEIEAQARKEFEVVFLFVDLLAIYEAHVNIYNGFMTRYRKGA